MAYGIRRKKPTNTHALHANGQINNYVCHAQLEASSTNYFRATLFIYLFNVILIQHIETVRLTDNIPN